VEVRKVDLAVEMQVLSFHVARRHGTVPAVPTVSTATSRQTSGEAVPR
jgi:redox-sensing transcriptional repressor